MRHMSEHTFSHPQDAGPVIATDVAADLLCTAMRDTEAPVMEMAGALGRLSAFLAQAQSRARDPSACGSGCRDLIQDDVAICIQSLQFHDRLIQQLTAVRRLMGSAPLPGEMRSGFMPVEGTVELF
jgi:hypothetical protein